MRAFAMRGVRLDDDKYPVTPATLCITYRFAKKADSAAAASSKESTGLLRRGSVTKRCPWGRLGSWWGWGRLGGRLGWGGGYQRLCLNCYGLLLQGPLLLLLLLSSAAAAAGAGCGWLLVVVVLLLLCCGLLWLCCSHCPPPRAPAHGAPT